MHPTQPGAAVRPAVPDSAYGVGGGAARRRTNSAVTPALPQQMMGIPYYPPLHQPLPPQHHHHQQQHHHYQQHQQHHHPHPHHHPHQYMSTPPPPPPVQSLPVPPPPPPPQQVVPAPTAVPAPRAEPVVQRPHFIPPLPWYSAEGQPFPGRRRRRRRQPPPNTASQKPQPQAKEQEQAPTTPTQINPQIPSAPEPATPATTNPPSEVDSTHPTTPSSTAPPSTATSVAAKNTPVVPATPPAVPLVTPKSRAKKDGEKPQPISTNGSTNGGTAPTTPTAHKVVPVTAAPVIPAVPVPGSETAPAPELPAAPEAPAKPALWADLLKKNNAQKPATAAPVAAKTNTPANGLYTSLGEALNAFKIQDAIVTPFLEPRGLVNTGNMCFMNAILQTLVFCGPFYHFLDRLSSSARNMKNDTPLIEAMIMFMREFRVITTDSKSKIKSDDLEALGEPFAPEYFYETIRQLKRFSHMKRGQQQDAEEFLGFLLDGLHEEAVEVTKRVATETPKANGSSKNDEAGWLEVGPKQKASTTRTTEICESPITRIFGGKLRSVFSVPGLQNSVTLEPYTPLQLDIHHPDVNSVVDALKHLNTQEKMQGDFNSPKGPNVVATKQVSIETLPPVLILHLKRFQYDNTGGTQKIWKKIAYPLELEIPREAMSKRGALSRYRLIGVVYHHGSSAQGGHYTVDVLRQDTKTWIRLDDTSIQMVAPKDVAVDIKDIGKYTDSEEVQEGGWVNNWEQVNGGGSGGKGGDGKRYVGKDSRTAYILFYQKI